MVNTETGHFTYKYTLQSPKLFPPAKTNYCSTLSNLNIIFYSVFYHKKMTNNKSICAAAKCSSEIWVIDLTRYS